MENDTGIGQSDTLHPFIRGTRAHNPAADGVPQGSTRSSPGTEPLDGSLFVCIGGVMVPASMLVMGCIGGAERSLIQAAEDRLTTKFDVSQSCVEEVKQSQNSDAFPTPATGSKVRSGKWTESTFNKIMLPLLKEAGLWVGDHPEKVKLSAVSAVPTQCDFTLEMLGDAALDAIGRLSEFDLYGAAVKSTALLAFYEQEAGAFACLMLQCIYHHDNLLLLHSIMYPREFDFGKQLAVRARAYPLTTQEWMLKTLENGCSSNDPKVSNLSLFLMSTALSEKYGTFSFTDQARSEEMTRRSAQGGDPRAQNRLGKRMKDPNLLELAAKAGYVAARCNLAELYLKDENKWNEGLSLLSALLSSGEEIKAQSLQIAGDILWKGRFNHSVNRTAALEKLNQCACFGHPSSQRKYASYRCRCGTQLSEEEKAQVLVFLHRAAEQGDKLAPKLLGHLYLAGECVTERNVPSAIRVFSMLDNPSGHHEYNMAMAFSYYNRVHGGTEINFAKALHYFQQALSLGSKVARFHMGMIYTGQASDGDDVVGPDVLDMERGMRLLKESAEGDGNPTAGYFLARMYLDRPGVPNRKEAMRLLQTAAWMGCDSAYYRLGVLYDEGVAAGCRDEREAMRWFRMVPGEVQPPQMEWWMYPDGHDRADADADADDAADDLGEEAGHDDGEQENGDAEVEDHHE